MVRHRSNTQQMTALRTSPDETANSDLHSMLHTSQQFYTGLYSTDPVEETDLDSYLTDLTDLPLLPEDARIALLNPITLDEILSATSKVVGKQSSPGSDGLGYAFLYHLFRYPPLQQLVVTIFNEAL
ncbi:hypothetical protein BD560DRAFT_240039 [Blakeslea trispora]|nr:hypothetical protein BD560DRAFT_240039 [Blakeslea trispora]